MVIGKAVIYKESSAQQDVLRVCWVCNCQSNVAGKHRGSCGELRSLRHEYEKCQSFHNQKNFSLHFVMIIVRVKLQCVDVVAYVGFKDIFFDKDAKKVPNVSFDLRNWSGKSQILNHLLCWSLSYPRSVIVIERKHIMRWTKMCVKREPLLIKVELAERRVTDGRCWNTSCVGTSWQSQGKSGEIKTLTFITFILNVSFI